MRWKCFICVGSVILTLLCYSFLSSSTSCAFSPVLRCAVCLGCHSRHSEARSWAGCTHSHLYGSGGGVDDWRQQQDSTGHCSTGTIPSSLFNMNSGHLVTQISLLYSAHFLFCVPPLICKCLKLNTAVFFVQKWNLCVRTKTYFSYFAPVWSFWHSSTTCYAEFLKTCLNSNEYSIEQK